MDEFFTEKTMAADPIEDQTPKENPAEAPNPYEARPNPASFEQPKPQNQPPQPQCSVRPMMFSCTRGSSSTKKAE